MKTESDRFAHGVFHTADEPEYRLIQVQRFGVPEQDSVRCTLVEDMADYFYENAGHSCLDSIIAVRLRISSERDLTTQLKFVLNV